MLAQDIHSLIPQAYSVLETFTCLLHCCDHNHIMLPQDCNIPPPTLFPSQLPSPLSASR